MDVIEAIKARKSIRAYKPDPVPKEVLRELLDVCQRAPSGGNTQPWEIVVLGGDVLEELKQGLVDKAIAGEPPHLELDFNISGESVRPYGIYRERSMKTGRRMFELLGINRGDKEARLQWHLRHLRFFDAPNGIILYGERSLGLTSLISFGIMIQTIMLAALDYGLGTVAEFAVVEYPEVVRKILNIPESKILLVGLAIGYPDMEDKVNSLWTEREPLDNLAKWYGFDGTFKASSPI